MPLLTASCLNFNSVVRILTSLNYLYSFKCDNSKWMFQLTLIAQIRFLDKFFISATLVCCLREFSDSSTEGCRVSCWISLSVGRFSCTPLLVPICETLHCRQLSSLSISKADRLKLDIAGSDGHKASCWWRVSSPPPYNGWTLEREDDSSSCLIVCCWRRCNRSLCRCSFAYRSCASSFSRYIWQ